MAHTDQPLEVSIEERGERYTGSYRVGEGSVTVYYRDFERAAPLAAQPARIVAEALLRDLINTEEPSARIPTPNPRGPQFKS
jgi:hypothetical protein